MGNRLAHIWYYWYRGLGYNTTGTHLVGNRLLVLCCGLGYNTTGTRHVGNRLLVLCRGLGYNTTGTHLVGNRLYWY